MRDFFFNLACIHHFELCNFDPTFVIGDSRKTLILKLSRQYRDRSREIIFFKKKTCPFLQVLLIYSIFAIKVTFL